MKLFHSITATCMAFLILVTTTGFSISQHFCEGELHDFALIGNTEPCEMAMAKETLPPCHTADNTGKSSDSFSKIPCCENHSAAVKGQELPTVLKKGDNLIPPVKFIAAFAYNFVYDHFPSGNRHISFTAYRPPTLKRDIPVLIQSFLI